MMDNVVREDVIWWRQRFTDVLINVPQADAAAEDEPATS